jgi:hypothetical protein
MSVGWNDWTARASRTNWRNGRALITMCGVLCHSMLACECAMSQFQLQIIMEVKAGIIWMELKLKGNTLNNSKIYLFKM